MKVLSLDSLKGIVQYRELLEKYSIHYPYFQVEFFESFSGGVDKIKCIYEEVNGGLILYPFVLSEITLLNDGKKQYYDIASTYGYSGPMCFGLSDNEISSFICRLSDLELFSNIVTEFIRFPLKDELVFYPGEINTYQNNIKGKIVSADDQWKSFDHKVRKNVKRAKRENLTFKIYENHSVTDESILEFYDIYIDTMKRTNAKKEFFYSFECFKSFIINNLQSSMIITVYDGDNAISTELVLFDQESCYSFLGGTLREFFPKRPNDFLKFEVINWAREKGIQYFVMGGDTVKMMEYMNIKRHFSQMIAYLFM